MNKFVSPMRKLNFNDVMIVPKKTILKSRKDVNLNVKYTFKNSTRDWSGVPLVCSNMDSISNYNMYNVLTQHSIMSCTNKHLEPYDYDLMYIEKYTFMPSNLVIHKLIYSSF